MLYLMESKENTRLKPIDLRKIILIVAIFWGGFEELQLQADIDGAIPVHIRSPWAPNITCVDCWVTVSTLWGTMASVAVVLGSAREVPGCDVSWVWW